METEELRARAEILERLLDRFRVERTLHLTLNVLSFIALFTAFGLMIWRKTVGLAELLLLFGSSGLIAVSSSRLLLMWHHALKVIYGTGYDRRKSSF